MAYTINLTNGTSLVPGGLTDGTIDSTHSSLTLIGRDYAGYGQFLNENFVYLLENFANSTGPATPLKGQLWWDTTNNVLRVWSGTSWKISTGSTASPASNPPGDLSALGGDLWFDTTNQQLKVYSGTAWIVVGPTSTPATGITGAQAVLMTDTSSGTHVVIQFVINGTVYAILSKDTFSSTLTGFTSVIAGLNFSTVASPSWALNTQATAATPSTLVQRDGAGSITVNGITAAGTVAAGAISASSYTAPVGVATFTGNLSGNVSATYVTAQTITTQGINSVNGYTGTILTPSQPNITTLSGLTSVAINGTATYNGSQIATVGGSATFSSINGTPIGNATPSTGAFTTVNVSGNIVPTANTVNNLGDPTHWFNNIYGTAVHAQYADLAERFHADAEYPAGTVVEMGGVNEITQVVNDLSDNVFGVISTNAAYLMNSGAGEDATHPPIAMSGRVPVRVIGLVKKGQRLVSAGRGLARAGSVTELTPWNVIGRSLVDKTTADVGIIEAIVKINS
jgi:hypothetical protein